MAPLTLRRVKSTLCLCFEQRPIYTEGNTSVIVQLTEALGGMGLSKGRLTFLIPPALESLEDEGIIKTEKTHGEYTSLEYLKNQAQRSLETQKEQDVNKHSDETRETHGEPAVTFAATTQPAERVSSSGMSTAEVVQKLMEQLATFRARNDELHEAYQAEVAAREKTDELLKKAQTENSEMVRQLDESARQLVDAQADAASLREKLAEQEAKSEDISHLTNEVDNALNAIPK